MLGSDSGQVAAPIAVQAELAARSRPTSIMIIPAGPVLKSRTTADGTGRVVSGVRQPANPRPR
ncbi:hypothetical protein GCM10007977_085410 [Dactylosporangium sucinum]|uniref:Uncharacterized protein n=1 Tax=Dactylosporangium sucinum TaxID=1424081 RepID=A0A917X4C7_9ACTN|nr:hypothetical protein GCM10007977_085410 [Dactylosporangium sucinum]